MKRRERTRTTLPSRMEFFSRTRSRPFSNIGPRPIPSSYSERKPTIRTRGENRMIGMKQSPRTDLAAL